MEEYFGMATCPECGKTLAGVSCSYFGKWKCSDCEEDKSDVLHCEAGCKVVAVHLDNGFKYDVENAKKYLKYGKTYEVESLEVGGWMSNITLREFPGVEFNTVHFERLG